MTDLIFALRDAAPQVEKEYCSPFGLLMDSSADALEAKDKEIAKYKALCDQMGAEMRAAIPSLEIHFDSYFEALAAWRDMK